MRPYMKDNSTRYAESDKNQRLWISSLGKDTRYYYGNIDDIRIYNIALSAGQIKELAR